MPLRQCELVMKLCHQIIESAHELSDSRFADESDRWIEQRTIQGWRFSYWLDAPVAEVRIVALQRIKS
jgi:hypothetical protein